MLKFADLTQVESVTASTKTSGTCTLTVGSHTFVPGDTIIVTGMNADYNGTVEVVSVTSTQVSYVLGSNSPGAGPTSGTVTSSNRWRPSAPLITSNFSKSMSAITTYYIPSPSAPAITSIGNATTGQLDVNYNLGVSQLPSDGATYAQTITHNIRNDSTGGEYATGHTGTGARTYSQGGLANATPYYYRVYNYSNYRPARVYSNQAYQYTRTVRYYGTISVNASGSRSYSGSNTPRAGGDSGYCYHGYYGTNQGLQKSALNYDFGWVPSTAVVTSAVIALNSVHWPYGPDRTVDVRSWGTAGNLWPFQDVGTDAGTTMAYYAWPTVTGAYQFGLDTNVVQAAIRNNNRLVVGLHAPGNSGNNSYYGYFSGATQYGSPLNISYYWDA